MRNTILVPEQNAQMKSVSIPPRVRGILRHIGELAAERGMNAYAVGGCVRDWLLGVGQMTDLDVTVEGSGIELARAAAHSLNGALVVHQQFGTATVTVDAARIDFASCRRETYASPAAYPNVSPGTLEDDLFRRDFTVNAMAVAITPGRFGMLVDPFQGLRDLRRKTLQMLHGRSFLDDPSRILRGIRFAQRFGLRWERQTQRALKAAIASGMLGRLNAGRLQKELDRMCDEPDPRACFEQFAKLLKPAA